MEKGDGLYLSYINCAGGNVTLRITNNCNTFLQKWNITKIQWIHSVPKVVTLNNQNSQVTFMTDGMDCGSMLCRRTVLSHKYKSMISHNVSISKNAVARNNEPYPFINRNQSIIVYIRKKKNDK